MKGPKAAGLFVLLLFAAGCLGGEYRPTENNLPERDGKIIELPAPARDGLVSVEEALNQRESTREFRDRVLESDELAQILWAASGDVYDGTTGATRVAPSAGATHPMEVYLVAGRVEGVEKGVYDYRREDHTLQQIKKGDYREELAGMALGQQAIVEAPASIVLVAYYGRTTDRYGERGERYVHMEAGHMAQNVSLQVEALNLSTVIIGAFDDNEVASLLGEEGAPMLIMPLGRGK